MVDGEYAVNVEFHFEPKAITVQAEEDEDVDSPTLAVREWHEERDVTVNFEEFCPEVDESYGRPGHRVTVRAVFPSGIQYRIHIRVFEQDE